MYDHYIKGGNEFNDEHRIINYNTVKHRFDRISLKIKVTKITVLLFFKDYDPNILRLKRVVGILSFYYSCV